MKPILTFDQWHAVFQHWTNLAEDFAPEPELGKRFRQLAICLQQLGLASPEADTYNELADTARYWLSTHYTTTLSPRRDARRYWNLWKTTYGERLEKHLRSDWQETCTRPGYIYLLKMGDWYKLGRTDDVMRRFPQISVKMPLPTHLWAIFYVEDMYTEEELLHQYYSPLRTNGEWFALSAADVRDLHSRQPYSCSHVYQRYKHLQANWRQEQWDEWRTYYNAYLKRANAEYHQRTHQ